MPSPETAQETTRPRLIVVDDDPAIGAFVTGEAEAAGYAVETLHQPLRLLRHLQPAPDLILLDLMLPGMDGVEVLRHLAASECPARIVLMSGCDRRVLETAGRLAAAQSLNIAGYLEKPIRAPALRALLRPEEAAADRPAERADRPVTVEELRQALGLDQFVLHYQPQVDFATGAWIGVEALVRWQHPERGLVYPDAFIPLIESHGLALSFTYRVLERALSECRTLAAAAGRTIALAVNLPPAALSDVHFPEEVMRRYRDLAEPGLPLKFEITETSLAADPVAALDILVRLRLKGFELAIDDFGTGHASLAQLYAHPFNELKIDLVFVRSAMTDPAARAIVERSIALGKDLGLTVLAEGVENDRLWRALGAAECDAAQGYMIARPMPADDLPAWRADWLKRRPGRRRRRAAQPATRH